LPSTPEARVVRASVCPAWTVPASACATGATVTVTVAVPVEPAASVTVYVKRSVPDQPACGA
jgi:hypothetical protein